MRNQTNGGAESVPLLFVEIETIRSKEEKNVYRICPKCGERLIRRPWEAYRQFSALGYISHSVWGTTFMCRSCGWWKLEASGKCPHCDEIGEPTDWAWDKKWMYCGEGSIRGPWRCPECQGMIEFEPVNLGDLLLFLSPSIDPTESKVVEPVIIAYGRGYDHAQRRPLRKPTAEELQREEEWRKAHWWEGD